MKKLCVIFLFISLISTNFTKPFPKNPWSSDPKFVEPIYLFEDRTPEIAAAIQEAFPNISKEEAKVLCALFYTKSGYPNKKQIGHDEDRKEVYSGKMVKPDTVVLTSSGKESLEQTVESLQKARFAHNFIIDEKGKIHLICKKGETVEQALQHRPFAVGSSCRVQDGYKCVRDMNSRSITISVVGKNGEPPTEEQIQSIIKLSKWLCNKYNISSDEVLDYGCVAYPYNTHRAHGSRQSSTNLQWQRLAQNGVGLWPKNRTYEAIYS